MRLLIAVMSFEGDATNGNHDAIRNTWGKDVVTAGATLKFFVGRRGSEFSPKADEVMIPWLQKLCPRHGWWESKRGCCQNFWDFETREMLKWSLANGYDYTMLCENDTFCIPRLVMTCGFDKYDVSGYFTKIRDIPLGALTPDPIINDPNDPTDLGEPLYLAPEYGAGVFLSRKAAEIFLAFPPTHWQTEYLLGQPLGPSIADGSITAVDMDNYRGIVSWHHVTTEGKRYYHGSTWQKEMYERYGRDSAS